MDRGFPCGGMYHDLYAGTMVCRRVKKGRRERAINEMSRSRHQAAGANVRYEECRRYEFPFSVFSMYFLLLEVLEDTNFLLLEVGT